MVTFFGLAIATKLSFALIIPFPIIYLWQNKRLSFGLLPFINSLSKIVILFVSIPIISDGYREMVLSTPEKASLISFYFPLNDNLKNIYITLNIYSNNLFNLETKKIKFHFAYFNYWFSISYLHTNDASISRMVFMGIPIFNNLSN